MPSLHRKDIVNYALCLLLFSSGYLWCKLSNESTCRISNINVQNSNTNYNNQISLTKTSSTSKMKKTVFNFRKDTNNFISKLSYCLQDKSCNVFYRHIGKTGGTTVEARMFQAFSFTLTSKHQESCCGIEVMNHFRNNRNMYCNAKSLLAQSDCRSSQLWT